jgi:hypothetical protein
MQEKSDILKERKAETKQKETNNRLRNKEPNK